MKTLLLNLVVVTIVCLDFGYTIKCKICQFNTCRPGELKVCSGEEIYCFKESWSTARGTRIERGCTATCPKGSVYGNYVLCCTIDECNI
uniref:Non-conventional three finger toxin isoform 4 n=1 Tax=Bungarus flaviceps TaxID=8614 RepID=D5J9P8_9SAUR|nr:non-conventional three finger toxin isoform 4 [Bungarus flaviceps]